MPGESLMYQRTKRAGMLKFIAVTDYFLIQQGAE